MAGVNGGACHSVERPLGVQEGIPDLGSPLAAGSKFRCFCHHIMALTLFPLFRCHLVWVTSSCSVPSPSSVLAQRHLSRTNTSILLLQASILDDRTAVLVDNVRYPGARDNTTPVRPPRSAPACPCDSRPWLRSHLSPSFQFGLPLAWPASFGLCPWRHFHLSHGTRPGPPPQQVSRKRRHQAVALEPPFRFLDHLSHPPVALASRQPCTFWLSFY